MREFLIVSATIYEIKPLMDYLENNCQVIDGEYILNKNKISVLITGVGGINTSWHLQERFVSRKPYIAINTGIAGSFREEIPLGTVVEVYRDRFADLGIENSNESFSDVFEMELIEADEFPYKNGWLINSKRTYLTSLPQVSGITVNTVNGSEKSISAVAQKYSPDIESMEGAAFFYACFKSNVPCIQLRGISNKVEPRNKNNWKIDEAIVNVNKATLNFIQSFSD